MSAFHTTYQYCSSTKSGNFQTPSLLTVWTYLMEAPLCGQIGAPREMANSAHSLSPFQSFAADDEWRDECNAPCQAKHVCHVRTTMDDGAREGLICSFYSFSLICGIKREREEGQCLRSKKRRKLLRDLLTILRELSHCRQSVDTRAWGLGPFFVGQHT